MLAGPRCEVCGARDKLLLCSRCRRVYYCGKGHQVSDWKRHKGSCSAARAAGERGEGPLSDLSSLGEELSARSGAKRAAPEPEAAGNISYQHLTEVSLAAPVAGKRQGLATVDEMCRNVIQDMDRYGVCVVDSFLGKERGMEILREVKEMHSRGVFQDGQLVNSRGAKDLKTIRSDRIAWVDAKHPASPNIDMLVTEVDSIVLKSNRMEHNGKMGDFVINGRTKAMVACYPGDGAHYVKHVDNPNKDGRCITAIYYLNPDWDVKKDGGLLRIFPEGWADQVADIAPQFDRVLFFWSDRRNPHEVQPSFRTRYAITLWYFDAAERQEACKRFLNMNERL